MKIRMLGTVAGTCDGEFTRKGNVITIGDRAAAEYIERGLAEAVEEEIVEEKVEEAPEEKPEEIEIDRSGIQTAEAAPPDNMAEQDEKPAPRRGPGRPRKDQ